MPDIRHKQIAEFIAPFRVKPGSRVVLSRDFDPAFKAGVRKKKDGEELLRQGVEVHSFKVPSAEELDYDYLWRYAQRLLARGDIGIFNRSYYEEVLVVRVHPEILGGQRLPKASRRGDIWKRGSWDKYQKAFSEMLSATSTEWAPWHVIPADRKWFARIGAAAVLIDVLMRIDPRFPTIGAQQREDLEAARLELQAEAPARRN